MIENFVITIGRQLGSGGREIGENVAAQLGVSYYDKELIQIASQESGLSKEVFEKVDEKTRHSILGDLLGLYGSTDDTYSNNYLSNEALFQIQSDVIRKLASEKSCIFVGRCADYVLKDYPRCLNIFLSADKNDRVKRIMQIEQFSEKKALEHIERMDKKRSGYYNYYSNKIWGAAESYHLCINSSFLGIDETISVILNLAKKRFGL
jgi:cytidylate kinase